MKYHVSLTPHHKFSIGRLNPVSLYFPGDKLVVRDGDGAMKIAYRTDYLVRFPDEDG